MNFPVFLLLCAIAAMLFGIFAGIGNGMGLDGKTSGIFGMIVLVGAVLLLKTGSSEKKKFRLSEYAKEKGYNFDFVEHSGASGYGVDMKKQRIVLYAGKAISDISYSELLNVEHHWVNSSRGVERSSLKFTIKDIECPRVTVNFPGDRAEMKFARLQAAGVISS